MSIYTLVFINDFYDWFNDHPLIVGGVIIGLLLIWRVFYKSDRDVLDDTAHAVADKLGLDLFTNTTGLDPHPFKRTVEYELKGTHKGVKIRVVAGLDKHYVEFGKPRRMNWYLEYYARIRGWPTEVQVGPEGLLSKLSKVLGTSDVPIGHQEFDRKFVVRGPAKKAHELIDESVVAGLLAFASLGYDFAIDDGHLIVYADPLEFKQPAIEETLDRLTRTARKIRAEALTF